MSIIDTLITDRSAADLSALRSQLAIPFDQWTAEQKEQFNLAVSKGAYNASDLNRVTDACEYLAARLRGYGYSVNVKRPAIEETVVTPIESVLPEGYTELTWIESTGTQYIDTGFMPNQDTKAVCDFEVPTAVGSGVAAIYGQRGASARKSFILIAYSDGFRSDYNTETKQFTVSDQQQRRTVVKDKQATTIDDVSQSCTYTAFSADYNLYLFANNNAGTVAWVGNVRIYSCQIYDNGTLVRDYIPCIDPGGEVGLYDIVTGAFYGNAGTGVFTAGEEVSGSTTETVVRDYWKEGDIPQRHHMEEYLQNVATLRGVLSALPSTPEVPADMSGLTIQEANDIELILVDVQTLLNNIAAAWFYSGEIYSGEVI